MSFQWTSWQAAQLEARARAQAARGLAKAAAIVEEHAKQDLGGAGRERLRASIDKAVDASKLTARVGTPLQYGLFLELGTSRAAPRPFLRRALRESANLIRKIFA